MSENYEMITTTITGPDNDTTYVTYGIRCKETAIVDISVNKSKIEHLFALLNIHDVSELHMADVIEDFLAQDSDFFSEEMGKKDSFENRENT